MTNEPQRTSAGRLPTQFSQNTNFSYRYVPTSKDFSYTRVLFTLFRNVMNYRNLRVIYVSVIYRHETHLCSILIHYTMHVFARKQCILCYALRRKVTSHYLMSHRFEIHSALELSRTALLCCRLAASRLR